MAAKIVTFPKDFPIICPTCRSRTTGMLVMKEDHAVFGLIERKHFLPCKCRLHPHEEERIVRDVLKRGL